VSRSALMVYEGEVVQKLAQGEMRSMPARGLFTPRTYGSGGRDGSGWRKWERIERLSAPPQESPAITILEESIPYWECRWRMADIHCLICVGCCPYGAMARNHELLIILNILWRYVLYSTIARYIGFELLAFASRKSVFIMDRWPLDKGNTKPPPRE
jgi:hypothetical protein